MRRIALWIAIALNGVSVAAFSQTAAEFNARGFEYYNAGHWAEAIASFERAYDNAPENSVIRRNLANAYQSRANELASSSQYDAAIEQLLIAIGVDPESAQPLVQLGAYYLRQGFIDEAIFRLEEAIELESGNVDAHFLLGEAYYKDNDASSALDQWEWVHKVDPKREGLAERMESAYRQEDVEYDFERLKSTHFQLTHDRDVPRNEVNTVLQLLEAAYRSVGRELGNVYPPTPITVTLYRAEGFSEATQMGDHVGGLYDGAKIRVPVIQKDDSLVEGDELRRILVHEYVHVVVRFLGRDNVPWWLNEGLAEALSRNLDGPEMEFLRNARQEDILFRLGDLVESPLMTLEGDSLSLAYRQSHATVAYLLQKHRAPKIAHFLKQLGDGDDPEKALTYAFHYNYLTLERAAAGFIERG